MLQALLDNPLYLIGMIITFLIAAAIHSAMKPKEKPKVDPKAFESLVNDGDWAEEEEDAKNGAAAGSGLASGFLNNPDKKPAAVQVKKKVNKGPYKIGDRIVLKNLVSAKELNGRHGMIADVWDEKTERYPVDLDLIDGTRKNSLSVKVGNLEKEGAIATPINERALAVNACLEEKQGRACAFVCKTIRGLTSSIVNGNNNSNNNMMNQDRYLPWKYWDALPIPNPKTNEHEGLYGPIAEFLTRGILMKAKLADLEKNLNPENPKGAYAMVTDAVKSELAIKSWNVRVEGQFWIMNTTSEGTNVIPVNNPRQVYCVLGYQKPLGALGQFPRPPKVQLTLLPWYGRLVHDPMLASTTGTNQMELASPQLLQQLVYSIKSATEENRIISRLAQLEVEGGSKQGVPFVPPVIKPPPPGVGNNNAGMMQPPQQQKPDFSKMEPATEKERASVENLTEFDPIVPQQQVPQQQQNPMGVWNFIRQDLISAVQPKEQKEGEEKEKEPTNMVVVLNARGQKIHEFSIASSDKFTAADILKGALQLCTKIGKRPLMFGVDDPEVANRLQFLLQGFKGMRIMLLKVQGKK